VEALARQGAGVIVRLNTASLPLFTAKGKRFALLQHLQNCRKREQRWRAGVRTGTQPAMAGPVCVRCAKQTAAGKELRKIAQGPTRRTEVKLERWSSPIRPGVHNPSGRTVFQRRDFGMVRVRWRSNGVKTNESLAQLGHLPKHDEPKCPSLALIGKLLVALLGQKLTRLGRRYSPWGTLLRGWKWSRAGL